MAVVLYAGLAFLVAAVLSAVELITAKYAQTWFLIFRCKSLWAYAIIYGVIAGCAMFGFKTLVALGQVKLEGLIVGATWFQAVAIGISVKSLLHINLFNITVNRQSMPVGMETFTQLFEPHLLRNILFYEFNAVREFIEPYRHKYPDLGQVKATIANNVPSTLPSSEIEAFNTDLAKAVDVQEAMERGLRFLGRQTFTRIFLN